MKIIVDKTKVMLRGKSREEIVSTLDGEKLMQVSELKYLGTISSEVGKLDKEFEERREKAIWFLVS